MKFIYYPIFRARVVCLSFAGLFLLFSSAFSQTNWFPPSGNVGIGTTSPSERLELSNSGVPGLLFSRTGAHGSSATLGQISFLDGIYDNAVSSRIAGTRGPGPAGRGELVFSTLQNTNGSLLERMRITYTGYVGIGTNSPMTNLHISNTSYRLLSIQRTSDYPSHYEIGLPYGQFAIGPFPLSTAANRSMVIDQSGNISIGYGSQEDDFGGKLVVNGNVGIGTANPNSKLEVHGVIWSNSNITATNPNNPQARVFLGWNGDVARIRVGGVEVGAGNGLDIQSVSDKSLMRFLHNGNVGIGTTTPTHRLEVNGTVRAKEVKLEANNWPDYVFSEGYQLPPLEETQLFIEAHGHLPGFKPAAEYEAEGVNILELNQKLLEKIEELTLYVIAQQSVMNTQRNELTDQRMTNSDQDAKINALKLELKGLKQLIQTMQ